MKYNYNNYNFICNVSLIKHQKNDFLSVRDKAAKTIQAFFSNRFKGKDDKLCGEKRDSDVVAGRSDDEDDEDSQEFDASSYRPAVTKCYKGHRNSRTLVSKIWLLIANITLCFQILNHC